MPMRTDSFGYDARIPAEYREIFAWLCRDVATLRAKCDLYLALYTNAENAAIISETAPASFHMFREALRSDIILSICRLGDPDTDHQGNKNLTLKILKNIGKEIDGLDRLLDTYDAVCSPVRELRNKRLGHEDLDARITPHDYPLPGISAAQIEKIVDLAEQILKLVYRQSVDGDMVFRSAAAGKADALIYWLNKGLKSEAEMKRARLRRQGTPG